MGFGQPDSHTVPPTAWSRLGVCDTPHTRHRRCPVSESPGSREVITVLLRCAGDGVNQHRTGTPVDPSRVFDLEYENTLRWGPNRRRPGPHPGQIAELNQSVTSDPDGVPLGC